MVRLLVPILLGTLLTAMPSFAADQATATSELALLGGYGITHRNMGATRSEVQTVDAILRYGHYLSGELAKGSWYQVRHELLFELPLHLVVEPRTRMMTGFYLLGCWKFSGLAEFGLYPYAIGGGGLLYNDLGLTTQPARLNFSYQGGAGAQYLLQPDTSFIAEWRYHHLSNAGTAEPNEPLNSSKFLLGITKFF